MNTKILVVDDEVGLQLLMQQRFRRKIQTGEYVFCFATSGQEALTALGSEPDVDVLLLDINMPDMDGLTLLGYLPDLVPTSRAVMVSAYGDLTNVRTAMNRGAFDFVMKPINFQDLELTIEKTARHVGQLREAIRTKAVAELKARFFDNITHEFRTPLSLIIAPTETLLQQPQLDALTHNNLTTIRRNAHNLLQLINQLLDLARLEADGLPVVEVRGDIVSFVNELVALFRDAARQKELSLHVVADPPAGDVLFDADKWGKILTNLLSNAIKFTPAGGHITVTTTLNTGRVRLTVGDTGIGIDAEHLPHIFDRFYQVDSSLTRAYEGSGIGLALAYELSKRLGGTLTVSSLPGHGTTFTLDLPVQAAHGHEPPVNMAWQVSQRLLPDLPAKPILVPTPATELPLLLVVEDNAELLAFLAESLAGFFRVLTAADGEEGLAVARRELPDVVVSDVMMPRLNGYQLTHALKTDPATDHIAVVLLTAQAAPAHRHEGLNLGADDYLDKPFDLDELRLRLRNIVTRQQALRDHFQRQFQPATPVAPSPQPNAFLTKLYTTIDAHLDESDFRAESLAETAAMSLRSLTRKLTTLTGMGPARLIRSYRLRRATELLRAGRPVSETAYLVGFEHPANFATAFKDLYQQTPTEFITAQQLY